MRYTANPPASVGHWCHLDQDHGPTDVKFRRGDRSELGRYITKYSN